jgi:WD40 repeat protein
MRRVSLLPLGLILMLGGFQAQASRAETKPDSLPDGVIKRIGSPRMRGGFISFFSLFMFSPDGKYLVCGGVDGAGMEELSIWDTSTGQRRQRFTSPGPHFECRDAVFSKDGTTLTTISLNRQEGGHPLIRRVLDVATGQEKQRLSIKDRADVYTGTLFPDGDRFAAFFADRSLRFFDGSGKEVRRMPMTAEVALKLAVSPDGRQIAVPGADETLRVYDLNSGKEISSLQHARALFLYATYSHDGRWLAALSENHQEPGGIYVWDPASGNEFRLRGEELIKGIWENPQSVAFSPDGRLLAASFQAGLEVIVWDLATRKEVLRLFAGERPSVIAFSPNGKTIAAVIETGEISLWDVATGKLLPLSAYPRMPLQNLRFTPHGKSLIGTADKVRAWDLTSGNENRQFANVNAEAIWNAPLLSPDESRIATTDRKQVRLWNAQTGAKLLDFKNTDDSVSEMCFSPDGRKLAVGEIREGTRPRTIRIWDASSGRQLKSLTVSNNVSSLAFSPDGRWLVSGSPVQRPGDESLRCWDMTDDREAWHASIDDWMPSHLSFSRDGRLLAGDAALFARVCDVATRRHWRTFRVPTGMITCSALSPDGRTLVTGERSGVVRFWEVASGKERYRWNSDGAVHSVAYSPDARFLAVASAHAPLYIWDIVRALGKQAETSPSRLEQAWPDLAAEDAGKAWAAVWLLAQDPEKSVTLLQSRLTAAQAADAARIAKLVEELASPRFAVRERAAVEFGRIGEQAEEPLRQALPRVASPEIRQRLEQLLAKLEGPITSSETLRVIRAVEVLEYVATPQARTVLKRLAKGAPEAHMTREAKASLSRLAQGSRRR